MTNLKSGALLLLFGILPFLCEAQQRFKAGIIAGLTASQIDGDRSAGYNKLGLQAGLRGIAVLGKRTEGSIEFLYAQRGCQNDLIRDEFAPYFSLTLNYVEIPVQWHYKDWLIEGEDESEDYYKVSFNGGFSYARFMGYKVTDETFTISRVVPDYLKKDDVSLLLGASFFATRHIGITLRYVRSLGYIYDPRKWNPAPYQFGWSPHSLYFQLAYLF